MTQSTPQANSTVVFANNATTDSNPQELNHRVALLLVQLAKGNKAESEKFMQMIIDAQNYQTQYGKCSDELFNSITNLSVEEYETYRNMAGDNAITLKANIGSDGKIIGYTCTAQELESLQLIAIPISDYTTQIEKKQTELAKYEKQLKDEKGKSNPDAKKIEKIENKIKDCNTLIDKDQSIINLDKKLKELDQNGNFEFTISDDVVTMCKNLDIELPAGNIKDDKTYYSSKDLRDLANNIKNAGDNLSSKIQNQMVYAQNYLGQYNSFLEGAAKAVANLSKLGLNLMKR